LRISPQGSTNMVAKKKKKEKGKEKKRKKNS
jgi:hypothetical protein